MPSRVLLTCLLLLFSFGISAAYSQTVASDEESHPSTNSALFNSSLDATVQALQARQFDDALAAPDLGAMSTEEFEQLRSAIAAERPLGDISAWDTAADYDVILQPGHYGRRTGAVGTSGKLVSERALAAYLVGRIAQNLKQHGKRVLVISADNYPHSDYKQADFHGLHGKIFLALHADGSTVPCKTGPSLAYESNSSTLAMHAVGWALSQALGYAYKDFQRDNFTVNEGHYYMFRNVKTLAMKGLLEVGELTCSAAEQRLIENADRIAQNLATALEFVTATAAAEPMH